MKEKKEKRKNISFKLSSLPPREHEIIDQWAGNQHNIQQSLANILIQVIGLVGDGDALDFNTQRKLHTMFAFAEQAGNGLNVQPIIQQAPSIQEPPQAKAKPVQKVEENPDDDLMPIYSNVDFEDD